MDTVVPYFVELVSQFPIIGQVLTMTGIGSGIVVKYRTFYLKIYDQPKDNCYSVTGYRYDSEEPVISYSVPVDLFGNFASQITEDNYLSRPFDVSKFKPLPVFFHSPDDTDTYE